MEQRFPRVRYVWIAILAVVWMGAVLARLTYLQLFNYSEYHARARRQQQRIVETSPKRGSIYDRNLRELAMSISVDSLFAVPSEITDAAMVARLLSGGVAGILLECRAARDRITPGDEHLRRITLRDDHRVRRGHGHTLESKDRPPLPARLSGIY